MKSKAIIISCVVFLLAIPLTILAGIYIFDDRKYYMISVGVILLSMVPFIISFENHKPQTREVVLLAVMVTIAVAGRTVFFMIPQFKPVAAIVIITGCSFSPQFGFLTGVLAAFVSNFFFGQGPWTPWQMLGFGLLGFLSGILFRNHRNAWKDNKILLCSFGAVVTLLVYGVIMDTASALMYTDRPSWQSLLAVYVSGFPFNVLHALSTAIFLALLSKPMFRKLDRIKRRYGMLC